MSQYVAVKTFKGEFGPMNRGMTYTLPERYARELLRNGLVRLAPIRRAPLNKALPEAPRNLGEDTAGQPGDGLEQPSSASPRGRRSRRQTVYTSNLGPGASGPKLPNSGPR